MVPCLFINKIKKSSPHEGAFFVATGHISSNLTTADLHQNYPLSTIN